VQEPCRCESHGAEGGRVGKGQSGWVVTRSSPDLGRGWGWGLVRVELLCKSLVVVNCMGQRAAEWAEVKVGG
jgi:hypothetical protein